MKLVDANVLLYAVNTDARHHEASRQWLERGLSGQDTVAFSWIVLLAFLRLSTKPGLFPRPLSPEQALGLVESWLGAASSVLVEPTSSHLRILGEMLHDSGAGGNSVNDAHLAALAIEHRATVVSFDRGFSRFQAVRWEQPPPV